MAAPQQQVSSSRPQASRTPLPPAAASLPPDAAGLSAATVSALLLAYILAYAENRQTVTTSLLDIVQREVENFTGWYDHGQISTWTAKVVKQVETHQRVLAHSTDSYLSRVASQAAKRPVSPVGIVNVATLRKNITHQGVYGRIADQYRFERSQGAPEREALQHVVQRARVIAETDMDLVHRDQAAKFVRQRKPIGWRRVIRPELSKGGSCGLCVVASDRLYHVEELMPIHERCKCVVVPAYANADPGRTLNGEDLARIYTAAGSTGAAALKRTRFVVHPHDELGPVLALAGEGFRTPADVARATKAA